MRGFAGARRRRARSVSEIRLDGRVVIVTGAGRGLGRAHALTCASLGAAVVVNDAGTTPSGEGVDASLAAEVVDEIVASGGSAVASVARVDAEEGAASIVATAVDAFGRVDALINNAGILRDAAFHKMISADWHGVIDVHLHGAWNVTRAAWPHLRQAGAGRVVLTTSHAALLGNFGQANYAAAKLGLVGLAHALAVEGQRSAVGVNVIAPLAASRLSAGLDKLAPLASLDPSPVSALAAYLCSDACTDTGMIIGAAGGTYVRYAIAEGNHVEVGAAATAADVARAWPQIVDMSAPVLPTAASFRALLGEGDA